MDANASVSSNGWNSYSGTTVPVTVALQYSDGTVDVRYLYLPQDATSSLDGVSVSHRADTRYQLRGYRSKISKIAENGTWGGHSVILTFDEDIPAATGLSITQMPTTGAPDAGLPAWAWIMDGVLGSCCVGLAARGVRVRRRI